MGMLYAIATAVSGCLLFTVGFAVDKYGARSITIYVITPGVVTACIMSSLIKGYWSTWFSILLLRFFGQGAMFLVPSVVVSHWFVKQRGRALSFVQVGSFLNAVIFPPVTQILIILVGWRLAWVVLALTVALVMLPLALLFFKNKP
jgi:MFS family permease